MEPVSLEIKYAFKVEKYLDKLEKKWSHKIRNAIDKLETYPPKGIDIKPMVGKKGKARVRVNDYRIVIRYAFKEKVVYIETIDTREDVYRKH